MSEDSMKHTYLRVIVLAALAAVAGCNKKDATAPATPAAAATPPVATIDGRAISAEFFDYYAKNRANKPAAELTAEEKQQLLDGLIGFMIAAQNAEKTGLDKNPETASRLELARLNVLAEADFKQFLGDTKPTEQELHAEYETLIAQQPKLDYRASHILVATEAVAKDLIERLNGGASFADLARKMSMDPSKDQGGDVGWFSPGNMVPEFSAAVVALKKGEITKTPVQTKFGWHVIRLDDVRERAIPDFEQVRDRVGLVIQQKKVQAHVEELKKTAKIEKKT
jgi:peptidyl-prolyl cis-trans isomerase C